MGTILRQGTQPIEEGDSRSGAEVEAEFDTVFTLINGNVDNANIKAAAGISGSKLAAATLTSSAFTSSDITLTQMAQSAVIQAKVETAQDTSDVTFTTSSANVDVDGFNGVTVTPGSEDDMLIVDFTASVRVNALALSTHMFAISVGGTDTDCQEVILRHVQSDGSDASEPQVINISYMTTAGTTGATLVKPRYRETVAGLASEFVRDSLRVFRVVLLPIK